MPLPIIGLSNFIGWLKISANQFKETRINDYVTLFLEDYLRDILGDAAFIDIVNNTKTKWTDLLDGVDYVNEDGKNRRNYGITEQLVKLIYFEIVRDDFSSSQVGKIKANNENSVVLTGDEQSIIAMQRRNSAVRKLQGSVHDFLDNYEEIKEPITGFIDNADNTYVIQLASTKYLDNGDIVEILGVEYTISGLIVDISFIIDAGATGLSFSGNAVWHPYEDVEFNPLEFMTI